MTDDPLEKTITLFGREIKAVYVGSAVVGAVLFVTSAIILAVQLIVVHPHSVVIAEPYIHNDFTLTNVETGQPFHSADQQGNVTVYYFGFTRCPDVCPETMFNLKRTYDQLTPAQQEEIDVVFITIDWERDTPEAITQYVDAFHEDFTGLTGPASEIEAILEDFNVQVFRAGEDRMMPGYEITHTDAAFVVDQEGQVVLRMSHAGDPDPEYMARDLIYVLNGRIKTVQ